MSFLDGILYKTGEFAELCGTTKETLRHYRDVGLLVPAATAENGYKLYSASQLAEYSFITLMRSLGCSLSEVARLMDADCEEELVSALEGKRADVERMRRDLDRKECLLNHAIRNLTWRAGTSGVQSTHLEATRFVCTCITGLAPHDGNTAATQADASIASETVRALFSHIQYCNENCLGDFLPTTYLLTGDDVTAGSYEAWICTELCPDEELPAAESIGAGEAHREVPILHTRPEGKYLVTDVEVDLAAMLEAIDANEDIADPFLAVHRTLVARAAALGRALVGELYVEEITPLRPSFEQRVALEACMRLA